MTQLPSPESASPIDTLDAIPTRWILKRLKYLIRRLEQGWSPACENREAYEDEWGVLKVGCVNGLEFNPAEQKALPPGIVPLTELEIAAGDVLISRANTRELLGSAVVVKNVRPRLLLCDKLYRLAPRTDLIDPEFLAFALRSTPSRIRMERDATGASTSMQNIGQHTVKNLMLSVPPLEQQRRIADFLGLKTNLIAELIRKKERLVELLQEKRQALITETVTKGLNSDVPMRHSGVESLGEIPAHWAVKRLLYLTAPRRPIMYGIVLPGPNVEDGVPIVKSGDCIPNKLKLERLHRTTYEIEAGYARARLAPGDIVFAIRGSIGMAALVPAELAGANMTQDTARIAVAPDVNNEWLLYAVQSHAVWSQLEAGVLGATVKGINIRDLKRPVVPVPPRSEQDAIAAHLRHVLSRVDGVTAATVLSVEKLGEYRQALLSTAVTGKLQAIAAAA